MSNALAIRDSYGRFKTPTGWPVFAPIFIAATLFAGILNLTQPARSQTHSSYGTLPIGTANLNQPTSNPAVNSTGPKEPCEQIEERDGESFLGRFECTTEIDTLKKWRAWEQSEREKATPIGILQGVCVARGLSKTCASTLYGMAVVESKFGKAMTGDAGKSHGWFHIHSGYHPGVKKSCAYDLRCSAAWTLDRMIRLGYLEDPDTSIMAHNGTPGIPATLNYLAKVKANMP